ncbi:Hypothetical protein (Fragment) [Durusdinium trenchii]|uniref:Uncharacterized protein n=2 Tax=Durusdinium trenchii TaxID=1381693 RepID=A0ABP0LDQ6_9DINO
MLRILWACALVRVGADIDNIFPILYSSNPVARHTACPVAAGQATVCTLVGYEENGAELQYLITSLPSSGSLYETSQNFRTYGTDPKYAATSIKDYELPFRVTDPLGRVVYIPPSDVFPPEGRWAAMTYEVQDPSSGNKSEPGQVSLSSPSKRVAESTFVGGTDVRGRSWKRSSEPRAMRRAWVAIPVLVGLAAAQPRKQGMDAPKWLDDDGKELFNDVESDENSYGDVTCETREKLLKAMAGKGDSTAGSYRARTLLGLGLCELKKENWPMATKRLESAISEMNVPNEDFMMKNPDLAPIALTKQGADFMRKFELTQAGTQLRRCREVLDRNLKSVLKKVHKQMSQGGQSLPLEKLVEEIPGYGKTGQFLPNLMQQVPGLKEVFSFAEVIDNTLDSLDGQIASVDSMQKKKKLRLDVSKSKGKTGSMLYVRSMVSEPVIPEKRLALAKELKDLGVAKAVMELKAVDKSFSLLKRTKAGSGCKDESTVLCEKLAKVPDIQSNAFGETRLLVLKENKKQSLDTCTTNANIGLLISSKDGVRVTAGSESVELTAGEALGVDFCLEVSLESKEKAQVLFAQAWHPEFAAVERTTELRARSAAFGLSEDEVKSATKVVNDHAKSAWDKSAKLWRSNSEGLDLMKKTLQAKEEEKAKAKEEAEEDRRKEEEAGDEERKKNMELLEKKRAEKKRQQEEAERKRLARKKQLEEEKAKMDPWLLFPEVVQAEQRLETLKEERRDANAKLEFGLSNSLTKDISAAERALKSAIKKAKKAYKKSGIPEPKPDDKPAEKSADKSSSAPSDTSKAELKKLEAQLKDVKERKIKATQDENFKDAKRLKAEQKELEDKIKKLEL